MANISDGEGSNVQVCDAEILDELTTSRGEIKIRNLSFNEERRPQARKLLLFYLAFLLFSILGLLYMVCWCVDQSMWYATCVFSRWYMYQWNPWGVDWSVYFVFFRFIQKKGSPKVVREAEFCVQLQEKPMVLWNQ